MRLKSLARMLSLALATSVAPSAIAQPTAGLFAPLSTTGTKDRLPGKFIFSQLITPSLEVAEQFYGQMFGWTFRAVEARNMRYAEIFNGDRPIGTIVERPLPPGDHDHPYWMPFVSTTDTDETARLAQASGGKILFKPHDIPGLGRETVVADPQSGIFVALHSQSGDPEDTFPVAGEWIWSSLLSPAPEKSARFYHNLFGYLTAPTTSHDPADTSQKVDVETDDHVILSSQDHDRGSINPLPSGMSPDAPARWLRFIRVDSAKAAADKAVALKGRVISGPRVDHDGATVAVLADPSGAVFGVLEWHEGGQPQGMTP